MKALTSGALASTIFGLFAAAALPSLQDCANHKCYKELLLFSGTETQLWEACESGNLNVGSPAIYTEEDFPFDKTCGSTGPYWPGAVQIKPDEYRPVCDCIEEALTPKHCKTLPCYHEMLSLQHGSMGSLRRSCEETRGSDIVSPSGHQFAHSSECGVRHGSRHIIKPDQSGPVCNCITSEDTNRWYAAEKVGLRGEGLGSVYIDVILHVILRQRNESMIQRFRHQGTMEDDAVFPFSYFKPLGINFKVKSVFFVVDNYWAEGRGRSAMRQALHQGDNRDLNLYWVEADAEGGTFCTPPPDTPVWRDAETLSIYDDGCVVPAQTPPEAFKLALAHWVGLCQGTEQCVLDRSNETANAIRFKLARYRFVPSHKSIKAMTSSIEAKEQRQHHCETISCYPVMKLIQAESHDVLKFWCKERFGETLKVKKSVFPYFPGCGRLAPDGEHYMFEPKDYGPACECATGNDKPPLFPSTLAVLLNHSSTEPMYVDVFIHAIASSETSPYGKDLKRFENELVKVSKFYEKSRIRFNLKWTGLTVNQAWAAGNDSAEMQLALYSGSIKDLNLYFLESKTEEMRHFLGEGKSIYCTYPYSSWWGSLSSSEPEEDGCIIPSDTPAGTIATAIQQWIGVHVPVSSTCKVNDCGPVFDGVDYSTMHTLIALNRFVPKTISQQRMRLWHEFEL